MARTKKLNLAKTVTTESPIFAGIATTSITGNAATVTTNANLTGMVTSVGNATTVVTNANLTGDVTSVGNATTLSNISPAVASGAYATPSSVTVDAKGRVTAITAGSSITITGVSAPIVVTSGVISLASVLPSTHSFTSTTRPTSAATTASLGGAGIQSLITKADGDFRYRAFSSIAASPTVKFASTSPGTVHTLASVPIGKYLIEVFAVSIHGAGGGIYTLNFGTTAVNFGLFHSYNAPNSFTPVQAIQTSSVASTVSFVSTSAATMLLRVTGTFEITAGLGVNMLLQYNQASAITSASTSQAQSYIVVTKLS